MKKLIQTATLHMMQNLRASKWWRVSCASGWLLTVAAFLSGNFLIRFEKGCEFI